VKDVTSCGQGIKSYFSCARYVIISLGHDSVVLKLSYLLTSS
jgi:hypothetical protein